MKAVACVNLGADGNLPLQLVNKEKKSPLLALLRISRRSW